MFVSLENGVSVSIRIPSTYRDAYSRICTAPSTQQQNLAWKQFQHPFMSAICHKRYSGHYSSLHHEQIGNSTCTLCEKRTHISQYLPCMSSFESISNFIYFPSLFFDCGTPRTGFLILTHVWNVWLLDNVHRATAYMANGIKGRRLLQLPAGSRPGAAAKYLIAMSRSRISN